MIGKTASEENVLGMWKFCMAVNGQSFPHKSLGDDFMEPCNSLFCEWISSSDFWEKFSRCM